MAGIYLHIPFCKQKCHYCNFFSVVSLRHRDEFVDRLVEEIVESRDYLRGEAVNTVYFGGGTPSLLSQSEINRIFSALQRHHHIDSDTEITLEANPDDLTKEKVKEIINTPVNRFSIGIQSFHDDDLRYLNRVHNANQAMESIRHARDAGFENLTIDLIYGIPTLTPEKWNENLETFLTLEIPHLSAYALTVEEKTVLANLIRKGKAATVEDEQASGHFSLLVETMKDNGFIHYEISNFAREGYYSKHNSLYWLGGNYLGLGPSAHSYNGKTRQWNASGMDRYMSGDNPSGSVVEKEVLSVNDRYNEYVMTSLRTVWGCDLQHIRNVFGDDYAQYFLKEIQAAVREGQVEDRGGVFFLTDSGKFFADGIASGLFRC